MDKNNELEEIFEGLCIKTNEYSKVKDLINTIKNDNKIQNNDKIYFLKHIDNIYFKNDKDKKENEENAISVKEDLDKICKKCEKHKFKKYKYCYKHCQDENIIPKEIKRKDYDKYIKNLNE